MAVTLRYGVDSEYKLLRAVLLARPCLEMGRVKRPGGSLFSARVDHAAILEEFQAYARVLGSLKIRACYLDPVGIDARSACNLVFVRDPFFMTPAGVILGRMARVIRRGEVIFCRRALEAAGISIRAEVKNPGTFEGADALWISKNEVLVGVGKRTNSAGFRQLAEALGQDEVTCHRVPAPRGALHLLGALQFVDRNLAVARPALLDIRIIRLLQERKFHIINIPESEEARRKHAMNFVTIAPKVIVMPADCPGARKIFESAGIRVAAQVAAGQFANAGGGLACATGILSRF